MAASVIALETAVRTMCAPPLMISVSTNGYQGDKHGKSARRLPEGFDSSCLWHIKQKQHTVIYCRVRNLKFATCENTNKINEFW